jgi:nitrate/TMAO reductase-like tetraheme cytochrome c subunit
MKTYVSSDPTYLQSAHRTAWTGVYASCADCHIPPGLLPATWAHIKGGINDSLVELTTDFQGPEHWESRRAERANEVRDWLVETDSITCRRCHTHEEAIDPGFRRGRREHRRARNRRITCIVCHYNLVHKPVPPSDRLLALANADGQSR